MSDISSDKIKELLSNPKNIELIASLASMGGAGLMGALGNKSEAADENSAAVPTVSLPESDITDNSNNSENKELAAFNPLSAQTSGNMPVNNLPFNLSGSVSSDKRIALLRAIKPYVSDSKKERVDGLVRAISVAGILNNYKGGLLG